MSKKINQQQAWAVKKDLKSNENHDSELRKTAWYAAENESKTENNNKKTYQVQTDSCWIINLSATAHCTDDWLIFENLILRTDKLITADEFLRIVRRKDVIIILLNRFTVRLDDVLFMLNIEINLLFTQALLVNRVENHQLIKKIDFYQENENVAKNSHEDKTSYLIWIQNENVLLNESVRWINENTCRN